MAQPPYSTSQSVADGSGYEQLSPEEEKLNNKLLGNLNEFLGNYKPEKAADKVDTLKGRYKIDLSMPLKDFRFDYTKAYEAIDTVTAGRRLVAMVCQRDIPQRSRVIKALEPVEHRAILPIVASGVVQLSAPNEERFVVFYERPTGKRLSELVAANKIPLNHQFIIENIVAPLIAALQEFSILDVTHGMINADNIFFDDRAMLGPCVTEPCGLSQPYYYESLERMQAHPFGKGEGSISQDYYALAVLTLYILHGAEHFTKISQDKFILSVLKEGAYSALMNSKDAPEIFYDFFRGTLTQSPQDRWSERQIKPWSEGKRYNVLQPPPPSDALRPFEFGDVSITTRRELAHLFALDWERMIATLQNKHLAHWIAISLRNKELSETIVKMSRTVLEVSNRNEMQVFELLMNIVLLLDQGGPIRINQLSMHIDGFDAVCANVHAKKVPQEMQFLGSFVEANLANHWLTLQKAKNPLYEIPNTVNTMILKVDRLRTYIRSSGYGFGLERMLYDLNPTLPCQSPILGNACVTTLEELLAQLDKMAPTYSGEDIIDRHIAAFITSKLIIPHEIRLQDRISLHAISSNRNTLALYLLGLVQEKSDSESYPGLTHWLTIRLVPLLDHVHSSTLRQKLKVLVVRLASFGQIPKIAELIVNSDFLAADIKGFQTAVNKYRANAHEIANLQTPERIDFETQKMSSFVSSFLANGLFIMSILILVRGLLT